MTYRGKDRDRQPTTADLAARARTGEPGEGGEVWTEGPGSPAEAVDRDASRGSPEAEPATADVPVARTRDAPPAPDLSDRVALLEDGEASGLRAEWEEIQTGFVDDPRRSVEAADGLVATLMSRLAETFADERSRLEDRWERGEEVTTEDLRVALRRYRSFFDRLLAF